MRAHRLPYSKTLFLGRAQKHGPCLGGGQGDMSPPCFGGWGTKGTLSPPCFDDQDMLLSA